MTKKAQIFYVQANQQDLEGEKLDFLRLNTDKQTNWVAKKKQGGSLKLFNPQNPEKGIFYHSIALESSKKQEELYAFSETGLEEKIKNLIEKYNQTLLGKKTAKPKHDYGNSLFNTPLPKQDAVKPVKFDKKKIKTTAYKPFLKAFTYSDYLLDKDGNEDYFSLSMGMDKNRNPCICLPISNKNNIFFAKENFSSVFLESFQVFPMYRSMEGKPNEINITDRALQQFQKKYQLPKEEQDAENEEAVRIIFNFSDFEECQVNEELAADIRNFTYFAENSKEAKFLVRKISEPTDQLEENFANFKMVFDKMKRSFERIGQRACKNKESFEILENYFIGAGEAMQLLDLFFGVENFKKAQIQARNIDLIQKENIFYYIAAIMFEAAFSAKESSDTEIVFYDDFFEWVKKGKTIFETYSSNQSIIFPLEITTEVPHKRKLPFAYKLEEESQSILIDYLQERWVISNLPKEVFELYNKGNTFLIDLLETFRQRREEWSDKTSEGLKEILMESLQKIAVWSLEVNKL